MAPLIACIPNFSEARRAEVVQALVEALQAVPGVQVLDVHSDLDHNRTVVTFVGEGEAVIAGAFASIARAATLINMEQHTGAHPRVGATDVVPFVPLQHATMEECVAFARQLGEQVGRELGIPVYFYEAAARRPDRQALENIRRGQYEGLKDAIATDPDRQPDCGPARLGPAGATIIGARPWLLAYNVYLTTSDVRLAGQIARAVRHSSGGLRYVKALGLLVGGQAQVSMNLTDFRRTPVHRAVELIRREAARYGVSILRAELVGLAPQAALIAAARWYLQLDGLQEEQILEQRLAQLAPVPAAAPALSFLEALAAGNATPGGGAAAAYAGAMAAALVAMVARLSLSRASTPEVAAALQSVLQTVETLRAACTASVEADSAAFDAVMQAYKLPRDTAAHVTRRTAAIGEALRGAAAVPLQVARHATLVLQSATLVAAQGSRNAISDVGTAAHLALASVRAAALNVRSNAAAVTDREAAQRWLDDIATLEQQASDAAATVAQLVQQHLPSQP